MKVNFLPNFCIYIKDMESAQVIVKILKEFNEEISPNFYLSFNEYLFNYLVSYQNNWCIKSSDTKLDNTSLKELMIYLTEKYNNRKKLYKVNNEMELYVVNKFFKTDYTLMDFPCYIGENYVVPKIIENLYIILSVSDLAKENDLIIPVLKSEDGFYLSINDKCILVDVRTNESTEEIIKGGFYSKTHFKLFATNKGAADYIQENKFQVLALKDGTCIKINKNYVEIPNFCKLTVPELQQICLTIGNL